MVTLERAIGGHQDCLETYLREIMTAARAHKARDANEFLYRMLRANAVVAQGIVWAEVMGVPSGASERNAAIYYGWITRMQDVMEMAEAVKLAFV